MGLNLANLTRRELLLSSLKIAPVLAAGSSAALLARCAGHLESHAEQIPNEFRGSHSLKASASAHGLFVGAAVNVGVLRSEEEYRKTLTDQYNMVVAENAMKWKALRPAPDRFSFDEADELVAFAEHNKMKIRGHNFLWHEAIPDWFASTVTRERSSISCRSYYDRWRALQRKDSFLGCGERSCS